MSEAVRSNSLEVEPAGGWYADQTTWCDFGSARNKVPLLRPNVESQRQHDTGPSASRIDHRVPGVASVLSLGSDLSLGAVAGGFSGSGFGNMVSICASNASPIWSVSTASAARVGYNPKHVVASEPVRKVLVEAV